MKRHYIVTVCSIVNRNARFNFPVYADNIQSAYAAAYRLKGEWFDLLSVNPAA